MFPLRCVAFCIYLFKYCVYDGAFHIAGAGTANYPEGAEDLDMELLWNALIFHRKKGVKQNKLFYVAGTLFTEDFGESTFMASAYDPETDEEPQTELNVQIEIKDHIKTEQNDDLKKAIADNLKALNETIEFCNLEKAGNEATIEPSAEEGKTGVCSSSPSTS